MSQENYNFHAIFQNPTDTAFIKRLDLSAKCEEELDFAVSKVKAKLTPTLRLLAEKAGVEPAYRSPKYRLQGSKVYQTQNAPAHVPQQQVDVDLGVYLSAAFLDSMSQAGGKTIGIPAKHIAKLYFEAVDASLRQLCDEEGWSYVDGESKKDNCCRIDLSSKKIDAHIDVPLYAMPNQEFEKLAKTLTMDGIFEAAARSDVGIQIDEDGWDQLEVVVMATRKGEWSESDVQIVINHFKKWATRIGHPRILRRLWRYVKAWRDFNWRDGGGPSSILLMEAVVRILDNNMAEAKPHFEASRDDALLFLIFKHLARHMRDDVTVCWGREEEALNRGEPKAREEWASVASYCAETFDRCFHDAALTANQVINLMSQQFGQRISRDVDLVKSVRRIQTPALALGTAKEQPSPQVRVRSTQGA